MVNIPERQNPSRVSAKEVARVWVKSLVHQFKYPLINMGSGIGTFIAAEAALTETGVPGETRHSIAMGSAIAAVAIAALISTLKSMERYKNSPEEKTIKKGIDQFVEGTARFARFMSFAT